MTLQHMLYWISRGKMVSAVSSCILFGKSSIRSINAVCVRNEEVLLCEGISV